MRRKNSINQSDLEDLKKQNNHLEAQIRALERAKTTGNFSSSAEILTDNGLMGEGGTLASNGDLGSAASGASKSIAPGQSLLLTSPDNGTDPPKKKMKQWKNQFLKMIIKTPPLLSISSPFYHDDPWSV